jgi:hypothetical protein
MKDASITETTLSRQVKPRNQPSKNPRKRAQEDRPIYRGVKYPTYEQRYSINNY